MRFSLGRSCAKEMAGGFGTSASTKVSTVPLPSRRVRVCVNAFSDGPGEGVVMEDRGELSRDDGNGETAGLVAVLQATERAAFVPLRHVSTPAELAVVTRSMSCCRLLFAASIPSLIVWFTWG